MTHIDTPYGAFEMPEMFMEELERDGVSAKALETMIGGFKALTEEQQRRILESVDRQIPKQPPKLARGGEAVASTE